MSKGYSGLFHGTLGTTYSNSTQNLTSYSERGIDVPENIKNMLSKLQNKGDYIKGTSNDFSINDVRMNLPNLQLEMIHISYEVMKTKLFSRKQ